MSIRPQPRGARPSDVESLRACVGAVFRPSLYDEYPQLFHAGNLPNCRVLEVDGKIVSHVGLTVQQAAILGCTIGVGCIGGVATLPEYRGRGYAGACLSDAMLHARTQGCDILVISGDRSLYRRAGARRVGRDYHVQMEVQQAAPLRDPKVGLRPATLEDIPLLADLHRREPIHWKRPEPVWRRALECAFVMNRPASFWIVERAGIPQGYLIVQKVREPERGPIAEAAGDWNTLLAAFAALMEEQNLQLLDWHLYGIDAVGRAVAEAAGLTVREAMASGTVIVLDFPRLIRRLWPLLLERAPEMADLPISFEAVGEQFAVRIGDQRYPLPDRGAVAHLIFGTREDSDLPPVPEGPLGELLRRIFPVPALWYGINYV